MKKLIVLLLVTTQAWAGLPPTSIQGQNDASAKTKFAFQVPNNQFTDLGGVKALVETGNDNLLKNPNFQATTVDSGWSHGASVTLAPDTGTKFGNDPQSIKVTLPAAFTGDAFYQDVTVPSGSVSGVNLESSLIVYNSGNVANLQVCARQGGADVSGSCANVPLGGSWAYTPSAGSGGGSGTTSIGVSLYASASTSGSVWVTHAYVGKNRNISSGIPGGQIIGQVSFTGCTTGWQSIAASATILGSPTGCTAVATGQLSAPTANNPGVKIPNGAPGIYTVVYTGLVQNINSSASNQQALFFLCSGSNSTCAANGTPVSSGTAGVTVATLNSPANGVNSAPNAQWSWTANSPVSNLELDVYGATTNASDSAQIYGTTSLPGVFTVYWAPVQSVTTASLANASANWSGYLTGSGGGWAVTGGYPSDFSVATTSTSITTLANAGITCIPEATKLAAITCTLVKTGRHKVCAYFSGSHTVGGDSLSAGITDGSNNPITGGMSATIPVGSGVAGFGICGNYNATSTTATFKVRGGVGAPTGSISQGNAIQWTVEQIDSPGPQPYTTGNISSTGAGMYHTESMTFGGASLNTACSSSPCTIRHQTGSWIPTNGVTRSATGLYLINFASGEFSAPPDCTLTNVINPTVDFSYCRGDHEPTISSWDIGCVTGSGNQDAAVSIICMGPH